MKCPHNRPIDTDFYRYRLTLLQRVDTALDHYNYETETISVAYPGFIVGGAK